MKLQLKVWCEAREQWAEANFEIDDTYLDHRRDPDTVVAREVLGYLKELLNKRRADLNSGKPPI